MEEYYSKLLQAHLAKEPQKYVLPDPVKTVANISELNLDVKSVSIYKYPNEHSVVLEGSNLWFCYAIHLGEKDHKIHVDHSVEIITGHSIQFNYRPSVNTDHLVVDDKIRVELHSYFSDFKKPIPVEQVGCIVILYIYSH